MNFQEYQDKMSVINQAYGISNAERDLAICTIGLAGEVGEVCELIKKDIRDGSIDCQALQKELGDVLAYLSLIAQLYNINLDEIAQSNIEKLESRMKRGVLRGNGNNR